MGAKVRESLRESIVVVGSILIAFALDAWWATRVEMTDESERLASLASEFVADRATLDERLGQYRRIDDNLSLLEAALEAGFDEESIEVADSMLIALLSAPTYDSRISGLTAVGVSGALASLEDDDLRRLLASWPSYVVDAREDQDQANQVIDFRTIPLLSSRVRLDDLLSRSFPWRLGEAVEGATSVTPSIQLLNAVAEQRFWNGFVIFELEGLRAMQDSIITRLRSSVAQGR